jgi:hypothetical protein
MINLSDIYAIEYCGRQNQFRIERLDKSIEINRETLLGGNTPEWVIVSVALSTEKAGEIIEELSKTVKPRGLRE